MTALKDTAKILALGGLGEIGMNCLCVEVESRILIIDCGVMFPTPDRYGIDVVHPSLDYLVANRDRVDGLILTHGHEDHIAAVPHLLREVDVTVYGAPYTLGLVSERMKEFEHAGKLLTRRLDPGGKVEIGPFAVESFPMPHSIVDNTGLFIQTPAGNLLHTGDFKLDLLGPDQGRNALDRLEEFGRRGVDLMISDSTGAEELEPAGDEGAVYQSLLELTAKAPGRVLVAIFSSNIRRLESVARVAKETGRKLVLAGRSVLSHARVASSVGALRLPPRLESPLEEVPDLPANKQMVVLSGTQGEERSALGRVAAGSHKFLKVEEGDLVVLSSRFIPGNEIAISRTIDKLLKLSARVVHSGTHPGVHVSGHGSRSEIAAAIEAVSPSSFLPAHGTYRHLVAGSRLASKLGVESTVVAANGQVVRLFDGTIRLEDPPVPVSKIFIDNGVGVPEQAMRDRRLLGDNGLLHAAWIADESGLPSSHVHIAVRGVSTEEATPWIADQAREHIQKTLKKLDPEVRSDPARCSEAIRSSMRKHLSRTISREPYVLVSIHQK